MGRVAPHVLALLVLTLIGCPARSDGEPAPASSVASAAPSPAPVPPASAASNAPDAATTTSESPTVDASAALPTADLPSFDAMQEGGNASIRKTVIFSVRDFKAMSNMMVGATVCEPTKYLNLVRIELDNLPPGTARKLVADTRCRRIYGKVGGATGAGPNGLYIVKVISFLD